MTNKKTVQDFMHRQLLHKIRILCQLRLTLKSLRDSLEYMATVGYFFKEIKKNLNLFVLV